MKLIHNFGIYNKSTLADLHDKNTNTERNFVLNYIDTEGGSKKIQSGLEPGTSNMIDERDIHYPMRLFFSAPTV